MSALRDLRRRGWGVQQIGQRKQGQVFYFRGEQHGYQVQEDGSVRRVDMPKEVRERERQALQNRADQLAENLNQLHDYAKESK
jgi:hypothetical protein